MDTFGRYTDDARMVSGAVQLAPELSRDRGAKAGVWMKWEV